MTVKELTEELAKYDPGDLVILSSDGEGNNYSPLADISDSNAYEADSTWGGEIGLRKLTKVLLDEGYTNEDIAGPDAVPCVVLYPAN